MRRLLSLLPLSFLAFVPFAYPQAPAATPAPAPPTDVLIFSNGDRLTGKLDSVTDGNVVFNSDMAGTVTISIDKIKELKSGAQFALLRKGDLPGKTHVPEGSVEVAEGKLTITPPANEPPAVVPAADVNYLIDRASFDKQMSHKAGFLTGWSGKITGGANIERSTTTGTTFYAGLSLVRAIPTVPWMLPRNRTIVNVNEAYGKLSTPVIPPTVPATPASVVITNIFHADAERDEYFNPRLYALADTSFDHNFGQGLQLQQVYGGGIGYTAVKDAKQELDLKADVHYMKQSYISTTVDGIVTTTPSTNIIGTTFFEGYTRNLPHKMLFTESLNYLPAWNDAKAYSANFNAALVLPVYKRLAATIAVADNYLNDPAQYYKKNSFQFIAGVTYVLP
ncbi:DUF481 domain-containing protein [Granulicella sp. L46]|uniref:DUF481 domain-containing protein n=1 Tax=Granulicella sp. L46 TaxID=1641865 RepID=UPI00131AF2E5|nr:DUF481 domain-containing protein [Granulicella sp. L46]